MAISDELSRIISAKAAIKTALENKGLTIGDSSKLGEYPTEINKIDTSTLLKLIDRSITKITIPSGITSIGSNTFNQCSSLKDVSINSNITSIDPKAFSNCNSLVQIVIPSSVTSIESEAFSSNEKLFAVDFLGNPSITKLKLGTFYNCPQLTYIEIPNSVTELEANVFQNCTSLTTIKIPSGVTKIGGSAFSGCSAMMNFVCMATTPPTISSNTFSSSHYSNVKLHVPASSVSAYQNASYWSNFTSINGIENIQFEDAKVKQYLLSAGYGSNGEITTGEAASIQLFPKLTKPLNNYYSSGYLIKTQDMGPFQTKWGYGSRGRTDISTFNELKYFNLGGFAGNQFNGTSLTSMELPNNLKTIPKRLFYCAWNLNHLIIPNSVSNIESEAFSTCTELKGLVIPSSVETINDETFMNVPQVTFISKTPPTIEKTSQYAPTPFNTNQKIYVPYDAVNTYKAAQYYTPSNVLPIAGVTYDSQTLTAQAIGRPYGQEMYIDGSLLNTSTYTFTPGNSDASHVIMVKCVDPSLGVLDSSTMEVLVPGA